MPTDHRPAAIAQAATAQNARPCRYLALWLYGICALVLATLVVGGATRITDSGLSITEWQPISGMFPPLDARAWAQAFDLYKQIPEYRLVNDGMDLAAFKVIYWWEWGHRMLGRLIGIAFVLPLVWFWSRGWLDARLKRLLTIALMLGALQGLIGWWMVSSGLSARVDVAPARLAVHLTLACVILAFVFAIARHLVPAPDPPASDPAGLYGVSVRRWHVGGAEITVIALVFVQVFLGALAAGTDAGLSYNTWPLMDGRLVPSHLFAGLESWSALAENPALTQFQHRIGACVLAGAALWIYLDNATTLLRGKAACAPRAGRARLFALAVLAQAGCGIAVVLWVAPPALALAHQFLGALTILLAVEWALTPDTRRARASPSIHAADRA